MTDFLNRIPFEQENRVPISFIIKSFKSNYFEKYQIANPFIYLFIYYFFVFESHHKINSKQFSNTWLAETCLTLSKSIRTKPCRGSLLLRLKPFELRKHLSKTFIWIPKSYANPFQKYKSGRGFLLFIYVILTCFKNPWQLDICNKSD